MQAHLENTLICASCIAYVMLTGRVVFLGWRLEHYNETEVNCQTQLGLCVQMLSW